MAKAPADRAALALPLLKAVRTTLIVIAVILAGAALWWLSRILEPFVLAVFLLISIDGLARAIRRHIRFIPGWAALPIGIAVILLTFGLAIWMTVDNAADFAGESHTYAARLNSLLEGLARQFGLKVTPTVSSLIQEINPGHYAGLLAGGLGHFAEAAVFTLIYLGFLLASRRGFAGKIGQMFPIASEHREASLIFDRVRRGVESYVWVQTVVGVIITALSAMLMFATGLTHIPFWCAIIFLTNYIPAIGAAIGVLFPAAFGLVEFDGVWRALVLVGGLEAIHFAVSHIVQPRMQGQSLNLDPIVILLSLAFWGALWGVVGAFLSTPLAVMAMAILAEFPGARPLAVLMSSDGKPYADLEQPGAV
ncbi:AI-2E family transporter [Phenylobacterium sp.]|uniref:AI-2E family transporter n=1 Tax=Phenylobacterium sp. TaxID=1871053 RepID=UPI00374DC972